MPHVIRLPSYTKDTLNLFKQIEGLVVPPDALLLTLDVKGTLLQHPARAEHRDDSYLSLRGGSQPMEI